MKTKTFKLRMTSQLISTDDSVSNVQCHKCNGGWINMVNYTCNKCGHKL